MEEVAREKEVPFIGKSKFGLTVEGVESWTSKTREYVDGFREDMNHSNERLRKSARESLKVWEGRLEKLTSQSPEATLDELKDIYSKIKQLEQEGRSDQEIIEVIEEEFPDLTKLYSLLRKRRWGYRLGSAIMSLHSDRRERRSSE